MQQSKVRTLESGGLTAPLLESGINEIITEEESTGFVLDSVSIVGSSITMIFKHNGGGLKRTELEFDFTDLSEAALTKVLSIPGLPASISPISAVVEVTTPFVGAGITNLDAEIGDTSDPNGLQAAQDLLVAGIKGAAGGAYIQAVQNAMAGEVLVTAIGANLDQLTAGAGKVIVQYVEH